ncbi:MAG: 50S ribosomal protein L17 [Candidatus Daviesbacteria bacterium]|nr:50S ribosomal protein L17 [Candidatus Daviesbacteria bacterium]
MRHRVYGKHLGRNKDQRKLLFKGLIYSLLSYGTIQTSEVKAKAIKGLVDKVIGFAKDKNTQGQIQSFVSDRALRERLIGEIVPKLGTRTSGFTRVVKMGTRPGDQTMMVKMSLIGSEELKPIAKELSKKVIEKVPAGHSSKATKPTRKVSVKLSKTK